MRSLVSLGLAAVLVGAPANAVAQDGYLFKAPIVTVSVNAGQSLPSAQDGVFDLFTRELTLKPGDFASSSFGGDIGVRVAPRFDIVLAVSYAKSTQPSEFRDWVDTDNQPIEQTTTLKRVPATLSARYFLLDRGRSVGRYAWVPSSLIPYVGGGGGVLWYDLTQSGFFVDYNTLDIFYDKLFSSGTTATAHVLAGAQWWPATHAGVTAEARYAWANATLKDGFGSFGSIDLKGFQWTAGIAARF